MTASIQAKSNGTQGALQVNGADAFLFDASGVDTPISIGASVAGNALTVTLTKCGLRFRNATLSNGTPTFVSTASDLTLTVPSGATLGTVNATASRIVVIALNNSGVMELAVVNISGGTNLSEDGLISTTAISAGSTSASVVYSTSARTNVPYRVVGYVDSTQATAGTWATAPSLVQHVGGVAGESFQSLGYGQTWQNVTGSRALGTTYYNTTGKPISVAAYGVSVGSGTTMNGTVGGTSIFGSGTNVVGGPISITFTVPVGSSYNISSTSSSLTGWQELR